MVCALAAGATLGAAYGVFCAESPFLGDYAVGVLLGITLGRVVAFVARRFQLAASPLTLNAAALSATMAIGVSWVVYLSWLGAPVTTPTLFVGALEALADRGMSLFAFEFAGDTIKLIWLGEWAMVLVLAVFESHRLSSTSS